MVGALASLLVAPAAFQTARADDIRQDRRELHQDQRELRNDQRDMQELQRREAWQTQTGQYGAAARTRELEREKAGEIRRDERELHKDQRELRRDEYRAGR
jgi:gas vesicle protein